MTRRITLPGFTATARGEQDVSYAGIHARLARSFTRNQHYIRPMLDVAATYIDLGSVTETGAGTLGLNVASTSDWAVSATPAIEIGGEFVQPTGTLIRPYIRAGITVMNNDNISTNTKFIGAPAGTNPFRIETNFDDVFGTIEAGLTIITANGLDLKFNYDGLFANNTQAHAGGLKLIFNFD